MNNHSLYTSLVQSYYTPNVQFEILFGSLLRPYISEIVQDQYGIKMDYITSEIPFKDNIESHKKLGAKADFLLTDTNNIYFAELKTNKDKKSHIRWTRQYLRYMESINKYKTFGNICGIKLLNIIKNEYNISNLENIYTNETIINMINEITFGIDGNSYVEKVINILKNNNLTSSKKYIFTLGQISDYIQNNHIDIWNKNVKLIYFLPENIEDYKEKDNRFFNCISENTVINITKSVNMLSSKDAYGKILADVIKTIYM